MESAKLCDTETASLPEFAEGVRQKLLDKWSLKAVFQLRLLSTGNEDEHCTKKW